MTNADLQTRYENILKQIEIACKTAGRNRAEVRLIAVSKGQSAEAVAALYHLGQRDFGENYLQELNEKAIQLKNLSEIKWHFIGSLQSNKIKNILKLCAEIHTVASAKHIRLLAEECLKSKINNYPIYLSLNIGNEESKKGAKLEEIPDLLTTIAQNPSLLLRGLMAIPPPLSSHDRTPQEIAELYVLLSQLTKKYNLKHLSLGMSDDLNHAINAGSTDLRIGTALFGPRVIKKN